MDIAELNKLCQSHLIQTLDKRFDLAQQRKISLKDDTLRNTKRIIFTIISFSAFFILPMPAGDPRFLTGKVVLGIISTILVIGILNYIRKYSNFNKTRTLDQIQSFYGSVFLQTTDKYKTTPRDRNRSLKKALNDNRELFPYPLFNLFIKDGYRSYLNEWGEILRLYPLWKIEICAIRMMFTNFTMGNIKYLKVEIDYRMEDTLNTLYLFNAVIELEGIYFLVSPFPITDAEFKGKK
ncbi:MAG: hypothetical protein K9N06_03825 [Candidatus Cloacimonetes bacterium]|nr:hypothetical protein [Candidatus Cloacimonadota bacterium]